MSMAVSLRGLFGEFGPIGGRLYDFGRGRFGRPNRCIQGIYPDGPTEFPSWYAMASLQTRMLGDSNVGLYATLTDRWEEGDYTHSENWE